MNERSHLIAFLILALFVGTPSAVLAQGWTQLPNTTFNSVSVPNNFTATYGTHTMPSYAFADNNYRILNQWGSAWADTKRNRLCFWGGGHNGPNNNSITCLDLQSVSSSTATCGGQSCLTTSNGGSVPTMTRINDPSVFQTGCPQGANYDGTPQSQQTWGGLVYLPKSDKYWMAPNADICPDNLHQTWMFDPTNRTWTQKATAPDDANAGKECALDNTTTDESVICLVQNKYLYRYDAVTDTWIALASGSWTIQNGSAVVIDPKRRMLFSIGPNYDTSSPAIWAISLDSPTAAINWTSTVTGCNDLMGYPYASLVYDPSLDRIVGYVPQTAANQGIAANRIVIFDPATRSCVTQPQLGGTGPAAANLNNQGTEGHFAYFPALGEYALVDNASLNAYTFKLNLTATYGRGNSTLTCADRDGDGYGVGPGCAGPDADDLDAAVRTSSDFVSKWGTISAGLRHLGYSPTNIWFISTSGIDATGVVNDATHPFATCCGAGKANPAPGDAVLLRGGTYTFFAYTVPTGTSGRPIVYMSYPGELAYFATPSSGFNFLNTSYVVLDGMKLYGTNTACVNIGIVSNMAIRHVEASGCEWGIDTELPIDLTIEDSVLHDAFPGGGQHGIYLTNHSLTTIAQNVFVRRNLLYNNPYTGFQFNGKINNLVVEQNVAYNNDTAGFSFLSGVSNSVFRSNISINNEQGLVLYQYQAFCDVYDPSGGCPYGENNNLIENFTHYSTGTDRYGVPLAAGFAAITVADDSTNKRDMGHNTYRNINAVNFHVNGYGLAPINANDAALAYFSTSTFDHLNLYNASTPAGTAAFSVGSTYYTCAQAAGAASVFGRVTNCNYGDPQFVAASTTFYNSPASFNLQLQNTSPALGAGTSVMAPVYDLVGTPFGNPPSVGAYESASASAPPLSCDLNGDSVVNVLDVQLGINQALGQSPCSSADLNRDGQCNVVDIQRIIVASLGGACVIGN